MRVCERVQSRTAFPGDEGFNYELNPGEAFAESYRVLIETNGAAAGYDWPIVDPSFSPDVAALAALREDVEHPWAGPVNTTVNGRFAARRQSWSRTISTPLDGTVRIAVTGAGDIRLLSADGSRVLSTGTWNSTAGKSLEYRVCGTRSVQVRITRGGSPARFILRVARP
jgi:hypothetical protein